MTGRSPIRILLVDASPVGMCSTDEVLCQCRGQNDFETVSDGLMALDYLNGRLARQLPLPDIILIDLNLPGLDGREVLELLRETEHFSKIPTALLTPSGWDPEVLRTFGLGIDCIARRLGETPLFGPSKTKEAPSEAIFGKPLSVRSVAWSTFP